MKNRMSGDQLEIKRLEELQKKLQQMYVSESEYNNLKQQIGMYG
ncbi:unnamed protein product [Callosobruchus maculatus]|uniref:Uncharacterized protein n=1 Tax=Callosobruchus maculatus TaxID=64391 RepID=A0A653BZM2_CALMS|nr:unnamed protein product [Callosobruchus maculatus]